MSTSSNDPDARASSLEGGRNGDEDAPPSSKKPKQSDDSLTVRVRDEAGEDMFFKIKKSTNLQKVFDIYAERRGVLTSNLRFYAHDKLILQHTHAVSTAESLRLEDQGLIGCVLDPGLQYPQEPRLVKPPQSQEVWSADHIQAKLSQYREEFQKHPLLFDVTRASLREFKKEKESSSFFREIVCYGVGNFSQGHNPLYQLAFALQLRDEIAKMNEPPTPPQVVFFDPNTTDLERDLLTKLQVQFLGHNERGKRSIIKNGGTTTLFFMPKAPLPLYVNLIKENWAPIEASVSATKHQATPQPHLILIGNSLPRYSEDGRASSDTLKAIEPFLHESKLPDESGMLGAESIAWFRPSSKEESWPAVPPLGDHLSL